MDWPAVLKAPGKRGSSQSNCRKPFPNNAGETDLPLTTHTKIHTQIKYQYAGQSLTKAEPLKETVQNVICNKLLRRNINNIIAVNRNLRRRVHYPTRLLRVVQGCAFSHTGCFRETGDVPVAS